MTPQIVVTALLMSIAAITNLPVRDACEAWLESRRHHLAPRTFTDYQNYIKTFDPFFSGLLITDVDGDTLRAYQQKRSLSASPETINKELLPILLTRKRINRPITDYQRLRQKKDYENPGRALTPSEEAALERTCKVFADHPKRGVAALALLLAMRTGMPPGEILSLKLKDIEIGKPSLLVVPRRGAKRVSRERPIVLVGDAEWAITKLVNRCKDIGGGDPEHYLIPRKNRDHSFDPTRPATDYHSGADKLLSIAGIKCRINDMRHHAMSKALRNPKVSLMMAREQFGHISNKMQRRYYHGSLENLIAIAQALDEKKSGSVQNRGK